MLQYESLIDRIPESVSGFSQDTLLDKLFENSDNGEAIIEDLGHNTQIVSGKSAINFDFSMQSVIQSCLNFEISKIMIPVAGKLIDIVMS